MRCGEIWAENATPTPNTKGRNHWRQGKKGKKRMANVTSVVRN